MDGTIKAFDLGSSQVVDIGRHNAPISSLNFSSTQNIIASTGYENVIQLWQPGNPNPVMTLNAENKIYACDFVYPIIIAGTANEKLLITDITNQNSRHVA